MAQTDTSNMTPDPERAGHWIDEEGNVVNVGTLPETIVDAPSLKVAELKAKLTALESENSDLQMQVNSLSAQPQHAQNTTHAPAGTD